MADGIQGEAEIIRKLRTLKTRAGLNALRRSLRKGARIVRDAARAEAKKIDDPQTAADISKNISVQAGGRKREQQYGGAVMRVGVMGGARLKNGDGDGLPGGNTTHWRLVELGTSQVAAQPFLRPAAANNVSQVADAVAAAADVELAKEIAKL